MPTSSPPVHLPVRRSLLCNGPLVLLPRRPNRNSQLNPLLLRRLKSALPKLDGLTGQAIQLEVLPILTAFRGRLLSESSQGRAVYAASFIRERRIVLETSLLDRPGLFSAILVHELFHFVWSRLGNTRRISFTQLLLEEQAGGARGGLGESSHVARSPTLPAKASAWKNYVCECYCDTAAFLRTGIIVGTEQPLAKRWLLRRQRWFAEQSVGGWRL